MQITMFFFHVYFSILFRKQIKDLKVFDLEKPHEEINCHTPISRTFKSGRKDSPISGKFGLKSYNVPISQPSAYESNVMEASTLSVPTSLDKNDFRFPSSNSFYDTERSKSRISGVFFPEERELSFKTECDQENSFVSGQRNFNSFANGALSRENSFDDLFELQDPEVSDKTFKETHQSFGKTNSVNLNDNCGPNQALDVSSQSSKEIDGIDYEDEMEVAMMYDEDEYDYNDLDNDKTTLGQNLMSGKKPLGDILSLRDAQVERCHYNASFENSGNAEDHVSVHDQHEGKMLTSACFNFFLDTVAVLDKWQSCIHIN